MLTTLDGTSFANTLATTEKGICICFKKLCPHCKNMEKVLEKFHNLEPDVALFRLDMEPGPGLRPRCWNQTSRADWSTPPTLWKTSLRIQAYTAWL